MAHMQHRDHHDLAAVVATCLRSGDVAAARQAWEAAHADAATTATAWLLAEIEERSGDQLWFAGLVGSASHYREAQSLLMPRPFLISDPDEAARRQAAWSRIANKVLYGIGPEGRRRASATGEAHPNGCPPPPLLPATPPPSPASPPPNPADQRPEVPAAVSPLVEASEIFTGPPVRSTPAAPAVMATPVVNSEPDTAYGHLVPSRRYRVAHTFTDFDGIEYREGMRFIYRSYTYFPYDEGLTLYHDQGSIRLCGLFDDQGQIMNNLAHYLAADS